MPLIGEGTNRIKEKLQDIEKAGMKRVAKTNYAGERRHQAQ
jgi:hypothetical protein